MPMALPQTRINCPQFFLLAMLSIPLMLCDTANDDHRTFVVVGAGPAGVQWGLSLLASNITDFAILEKNDGVGSFFDTYPRKRKLISANKFKGVDHISAEFGMRHDWHSLLDTDVSFAASGNYSREWYPVADTLVEYLNEAARPLKDHLKLNTEVTNTFFDKLSERWKIETADGRKFSADHLVIASGYTPIEPPSCLKEEAEKNGATFYTYGNFPKMETGDEEWCSNRDIWVFGGGNAAWETTDMLAPCAKSVKLFHKGMPRFSFLTHYVGDVRIHNAAILDRYMLKSLDGLFNLRDLEKPTPTPGTGSFESLVAAHTGIETQRAPPDIDSEECAAFENLFFGLQDNVTVVYSGGFTTERDGIVNATFNKRFPELTSWWKDKEVISAPRKWYAGCAMHGTDYRQSAGGFIHGFRYSIRAQIRHILQEHFNGSWPVVTFESYEEAVEYTNRRVQEAAGLYQMQDVLVDILVADADGTFSYYEEVPKWWMTDIFPGGAEKMGFITVEFKYTNKDVWDFQTIADSSRNDRNPGIFLHPVITLFWEGEKVPESESHLPEDAEGTWRGNNNIVELSFALHKAREQLRALATTGRAMSNAHAQTATVLRSRCTKSNKVGTKMSEHNLLCDDVYNLALGLTQPSIFTSIYRWMLNTVIAAQHSYHCILSRPETPSVPFTRDTGSVDGTLRCEDLRNFAPPMQSHLNALNNSVSLGHYSTAIYLAKQLAVCEELDEEGPISTPIYARSDLSGRVNRFRALNYVAKVYTYRFDFQDLFYRFHKIESMSQEEKKELEDFVADFVTKAKKVENPLEPRQRLDL